MERGKIIAILTGAISILLAVVYLVIVQLLDFRGEMIPAPVGITFSHQLSVHEVAIADSTPSPKMPPVPQA